MKTPRLLVTLEDIPPEGRDVVLNVDPGSLAALVSTESEEPPKILSPLTGLLRLTRTSSRLSVKGGFQVKVEIPCDRCLAPNPVILTSEVDERLDLVNPGEKPGEDDDLDGGLEMQNGQVNLSGLLAELFWLAWPFRHICRPGCAGICPRCGADLNSGPCNCADIADAG